MSVRSALADPRPTWHHPKIVLVLLTVFLCGAAAGVLTIRFASPARPAAPVWKEGGRELTLDMMKRQLELTPEQAQKIETVLDDLVIYYKNLQGQMDDFRADGKQRIVAILTPEQRKKFHQMMNSLSARLR